MSVEEYKQFLSKGTRTGKLATVRKDGRPHVTPIWFDLDGDELVFTTWHGSVKAANMRRDARVSICVDEEIPPFAFVIFEGMVTITEDADERAYWARRIAARKLRLGIWVMTWPMPTANATALQESLWYACNRRKSSPRTMLQDE